MADELDPIDEAFARLSVHEFILEVITAQLLAESAADFSTTFKERVREFGRHASGPITADRAANMQAIDARRLEMLDQLIAQIAALERGMRAASSQNPSTQ